MRFAFDSDNSVAGLFIHEYHFLYVSSIQMSPEPRNILQEPYTLLFSVQLML